ncbi:MAG: FecR domain-containing protein [Chloroflexi bacterium]|nr:MAG: FecR domain-containing protein [Chloroflexota bacterium]
MAIQSPPPAPVLQQAVPPTTPQKSSCFGRGCGCGLGGCLVVVILAVLLVGGGGYWFFVVQASAAVTAPATLILFNQPVTVNSNPGTPGESLNANDTVATQAAGHASIQFPDGSYIRMSPQTTVQITSIQLQKAGNVQAIEALQKTGRTLVNVQHLANGATFKVNGHAVSAAVRGTQFEMLVRPNNTNLIKVFDGTVRVSGQTIVNVTAGNEVEVDANGKLSAVRPIQRDTQDPYPLATQCSRAVSGGTTAGTAQTSTGDSLSTGETAEVGYDSPGGVVNVALCYPGSTMTLSVFDPNGTEHQLRGGQSSVSGPAGHYRAIVHAVNVSPAEAYAVSFASNAPCDAANVDSGGVVRETLSNSQIATALAESGTSGVTIYVDGTSPTGARIVYYSNIGGMPISWTVDFYAATPNLGAVITQVTVRGINVTTQVVTNLSSFGGHSISSIPSGFIVDRVYSCAALTGDKMMVVEGHR